MTIPFYRNILLCIWKIQLVLNGSASVFSNHPEVFMFCERFSKTGNPEWKRLVTELSQFVCLYPKPASFCVRHIRCMKPQLIHSCPEPKYSVPKTTEFSKLLRVFHDYLQCKVASSGAIHLKLCTINITLTDTSNTKSF